MAGTLCLQCSFSLSLSGVIHALKCLSSDVEPFFFTSEFLFNKVVVVCFVKISDYPAKCVTFYFAYSAMTVTK